MRVRPLNLALSAALLALAGLGAWLWSRVGLAVWLDAALAFCT
jgi:hypothetical protein